MNNEGFGSNGSAYEYTVACEGRRKTLSRLILLTVYAIWVIAFFTMGVLTRILLPLLCFIPLTLCILVFFTWRLTKKEIKLSFLAGRMTVIRQFDGKNQKKLAEVPIKEIETVKPYDASDVSLLHGKHVIHALKNDSEEGAYLALFGQTALLFEANEKALKILKYYGGFSL
ncbi:MAG: hypothetical protein IKA76_08800 [Clostridia bacterium]|nr:hypothetical protein [Clostridia bacterium]